MKPEEIERKSFEIIDSEIGEHSFSAEEYKIVQRAIHATADFEFKNTIKFSPDAILKGKKAISEGCGILVDTNMLKSAVTATVWKKGCTVHSFIADEDVVSYAGSKGITRTEASIRKAFGLLDKNFKVDDCRIIAIGNAPTALFETLRLIEEGIITPSLVIGVPVGFVGAIESKTALLKSNATYITALGRKGGTPVAAAILNAICRL